MLNYSEIKKIRELYNDKQNILLYLKQKNKTKVNNIESILYSYDLQSGFYYKNRNSSTYGKLVKIKSNELLKIIKKIKPTSILESGIGEGNVLGSIGINKNIQTYGFDISLSRLLYAKKFLKNTKNNTKLFCADLENIPLKDNSIDLVYTSNSLEPNHGKEEKLIDELGRISKKWIVLIEPTFELGSTKTRNHIKKHGYVRGLPKILKKKGYEVVSNEYMELPFKTNNEISIIIAKKTSKIQKSMVEYISPISQTKLKKYDNFLYSKEDGFLFPIIKNIPCLLKNNGILASKITKFM